MSIMWKWLEISDTIEIGSSLTNNDTCLSKKDIRCYMGLYVPGSHAWEQHALVMIDN